MYFILRAAWAWSFFILVYSSAGGKLRIATSSILAFKLTILSQRATVYGNKIRLCLKMKNTMNGSVNIFRVCMSCKHNGGGAKCQGVIDSGAPRLYRSRESDSCAGLSQHAAGVYFLCMKPRGQWKWAAHITPFEAFWITEHWTTLSGVFSISEPFQHSSNVRFKEVQSQVHHFWSLKSEHER